MRKYLGVFASIAIFATQPLLAATSMDAHDTDASSPQCEAIAKACLNAGFSDAGAPGKAFWFDCMKPVMMGKTVAGVNIDHKDVMACRAFKIKSLQKELEEFRKVKGN